MSLGEEMFEWRKQMVEKLLLQESNIDQLEEKLIVLKRFFLVIAQPLSK